MSLEFKNAVAKLDRDIDVYKLFVTMLRKYKTDRSVFMSALGFEIKAIEINICYESSLYSVISQI